MDKYKNIKKSKTIAIKAARAKKLKQRYSSQSWESFVRQFAGEGYSKL